MLFFSRKRGFNEVVTPNMYNAKLWQTSGHWAHYAENMFSFDVEKETFALKPMNCPGHWWDMFYLINLSDTQSWLISHTSMSDFTLSTNWRAFGPYSPPKPDTATPCDELIRLISSWSRTGPYICTCTFFAQVKRKWYHNPALLRLPVCRQSYNVNASNSFVVNWRLFPIIVGSKIMSTLAITS